MKSVLWIVLLAALTLAIRGHNLRNTFIEGRIYFVDADCYSRMTRAQIVDQHPGTVVRWHEFENFPKGVMPHTTAPLDYLIVGLKWILSGVSRLSESLRTSILATQWLDVAGALISPLLGVATVIFLSVWARWWMRRSGGDVPLNPWLAASPGLLFAVCPILVHGTLLGRPDHQSLLLFLMAVALGADWVFTERRTLAWAATSGVAWGLALWVSVYEPGILLLGMILFRWVERRFPVAAPRSETLEYTDVSEIANDTPPAATEPGKEARVPSASWWTPGRVKWCALAGVVLLALLIERWHFQLADESLKKFFGQWASSIGELRHLNPRKPILYRWLGWAWVISPILLVLAARRDRRAISVLGLLLLTFGLTCWQIRWGYFLALAYAMSLPWQLAVLRWRWLAWPLLVLSLWPTWKEWDEQLFPNSEAEKQFALRRIELHQLRGVASAMRSEDTRAFIAPWWLSPPLAYWSGQPGVAGSSHESLSGIVDTARFYTAGTPEEAAAILRARNVDWVVADDAARLLGTSKAILASDPPPNALAYSLAEKPNAVPPFLVETPLTSSHSALGAEAGGPQFFRLYRVAKEQLQP
ncbi:hypothetical protein ACXR0O_00670 [Verrucomicrobiota bacterium sgz303538]